VAFLKPRPCTHKATALIDVRLAPTSGPERSEEPVGHRQKRTFPNRRFVGIRGRTSTSHHARPAARCHRPGSTATTCPHRIDLILFRGFAGVDNMKVFGDLPSDRTPSGLWPSDHAGLVATLRGPKSQPVIADE